MPDLDEQVQQDVQKAFGVRPCLWQVRVARSVLEGKDVFTIAGTGAGKTLTYWIVLLYIEDGVVIMVTPLKQLGAQFADWLVARNFPAVNVTKTNAKNNVYEVLIAFFLYSSRSLIFLLGHYCMQVSCCYI